MKIRLALKKDIPDIMLWDKHISLEELSSAVFLKRVYVIEEEGVFAGVLRYHLFWGNTPFMDMLYIVPQKQGKGLGKALVTYWEKQMNSMNYDYVMTSTSSLEKAQFFYIHLGYREIGGFHYKKDAYELLFAKEI